MKIFEFNDELSFLERCVDRIGEISESKIRTSEIFNIVLTGGETAKEVYNRLANLKTDWSKWRFYFGDERFLNEGDAELNSVMADQYLFSSIPVLSDQIFKIPTFSDCITSASLYSHRLQSISTFDLVLLGLGEDGHVASLFPGKIAGMEEDSPSVVPVFDSPKPPKERISLSLGRINHADHHLIITKGKQKRQVIDLIRSNTQTLPVMKLSPNVSLELYYCNV
ncbi:6-phosphogluconolactonase [Leptospira yasudae]|uniref:6-phosphogluconolactonase n=1 Tax=Leptospira yasudae TaxID=2202201 RepID=UPI001C4E8538|nr:6-phosphogluconolactonase [Leptospira yasudae]MBW0434121.1 6-phosphogluconolactonase [Leptospira yasudae]